MCQYSIHNLKDIIDPINGDDKLERIFNKRNNQKKIIDQHKQQTFFKERDVFFIRMGKNIRFEQNGKGNNFTRPVVIIKKFNNDIYWGVALSSKQRPGKYYYNFDINGILQCAIISQLRLYDKNKLVKKIGMISPKEFFELKQKIKNLL